MTCPRKYFCNHKVGGVAMLVVHLPSTRTEVQRKRPQETYLLGFQSNSKDLLFLEDIVDNVNSENVSYV